ncbi:hypothetical protein J6590_049363 [Homalodisca vitripennis]|nr:hypothetical protein J6590_049363 [Homalodisca vitripennis]
MALRVIQKEKINFLNNSYTVPFDFPAISGWTSTASGENIYLLASNLELCEFSVAAPASTIMQMLASLFHLCSWTSVNFAPTFVMFASISYR